MAIGAAVVIIGVSFLVGGVSLAFLALSVHMEETGDAEEIDEHLPGLNCEACGYTSCREYAVAVSYGGPANQCIPGGQPLADELALIRGTKPQAVTPHAAFLVCQGTPAHVGTKYRYPGLQTCAACAGLYSSNSDCEFACIGFGDCKRVCPYGAITLRDGIACVDVDKCTGCGLCAKACPKQVIVVRALDDRPLVACASQVAGEELQHICTAGCTACGACAAVCPEQAIAVKENLARIHYNRCTACGQCVPACPAGVIRLAPVAQAAV